MDTSGGDRGKKVDVDYDVPYQYQVKILSLMSFLFDYSTCMFNPCPICDSIALKLEL